MEPIRRPPRGSAPVSELLLWSRRTLRRVAGSAVGRAGLRSTQWLRGDFPHGAVADVDVAEGNLYWADPTQRRLFRWEPPTPPPPKNTPNTPKKNPPKNPQKRAPKPPKYPP